MIKTYYRYYRISKSKIKKKAVYITFAEPVTNQNIKKSQAELLQLLKKNIDSYIIVFNDSSKITAYTLKLLAALYNTFSNKIGIILPGKIKQFFSLSRLDSHFLIEENPVALISRIERNLNKPSGVSKR